MSLDKLSILEEMFPNGFLIMYAKSDGYMEYAKVNPKRITIIEQWERHILDGAKGKGPDYWKGFISAEDIPDFFPDN